MRAVLVPVLQSELEHATLAHEVSAQIGIFVPLQALIDSHGFRLVAMPIVPVHKLI